MGYHSTGQMAFVKVLDTSNKEICQRGTIPALVHGQNNGVNKVLQTDSYGNLNLRYAKDTMDHLLVSNPDTIMNLRITDTWNQVINTTTSGDVLEFRDVSHGMMTLSTNSIDSYVKHATKRRATGLLKITGTLDADSNGTGVTTWLGYRDEIDGIYFQHTGTGAAVVVNNNGTETIVLQNNWNGDKVDGTGVSKIDVSWALSQTFIIDFQDLQDTICYAMVLDGEMIIVHVLYNSNVRRGSPMRSRDLPIGYGIQSNSLDCCGSMDLICATVVGERNRSDSQPRSYDTGVPVNYGAAAERHLFSLRLGSPATIRWNNYTTICTTNTVYKVSIYYTPSVYYSSTCPVDISMASWTDIDPSYSSMQSISGHALALDLSKSAKISMNYVSKDTNTVMPELHDFGASDVITFTITYYTANEVFAGGVNWYEYT